VWGFEDSYLGLLLAVKGVKLVPCPSSLAYKVEFEDEEEPENKELQIDHHRQTFWGHAGTREWQSYNQDKLKLRIEKLRTQNLLKAVTLEVPGRRPRTRGVLPITGRDEGAASDTIEQQLEALRATQEKVLQQAQRQTELLAQISLQNLQINQDEELLTPQQEVAALSERSNITPSADALRKAAKEAMAKNDIAEALRAMEKADGIEARAEADALRRAERLRSEAQEAHGAALAHSISRAQTQSAYASILDYSGDFDGARRLYESAIQRLPGSEDELRGIYSKKLRIVLNNISARTERIDSIKSILLKINLPLHQM
jgi:tetratricopeptide (TPR) repeat protein